MSESLAITLLTPLDPFSSFTGGEINTRNLAQELVLRGHNVSLVHSYVSQRRESMWNGVRCYAVPSIGVPFVGNFQANLRVVDCLRNLAREHGHDILDSAGAGLGYAFTRAASTWDRSVFHAVDLTLQELRSLPGLSAASVLPRYLALAYSERKCVEVADWVIVDTAAVGSLYQSLYRGVNGKLSAIPPPIPRSWHPIDYGEHDPLHFLYIGAGPRRDTGLFLAAMNELKRRGFRVRGTIIREPRKEYRRMSAALALDVEYLSGIPDSRLREIFANACALVLPSHREAYCKSTVEAGYHGTPTVTSNLEPVREYVSDGKTGIVVESWRPTDWADALSRLIVDSDLRQKLGSNAKSLAMNRYSTQTIVDLILDGYKDLLAGRRVGSLSSFAATAQ